MFVVDPVIVSPPPYLELYLVSMWGHTGGTRYSRPLPLSSSQLPVPLSSRCEAWSPDVSKQLPNLPTQCLLSGSSA